MTTNSRSKRKHGGPSQPGLAPTFAALSAPDGGAQTNGGASARGRPEPRVAGQPVLLAREREEASELAASARRPKSRLPLAVRRNSPFELPLESAALALPSSPRAHARASQKAPTRL